MKEYKNFKYEWTKHGWRVIFPTGFKTFIKDLTKTEEQILLERLNSLEPK